MRRPRRRSFKNHLAWAITFNLIWFSAMAVWLVVRSLVLGSAVAIGSGLT